MRFQNQASGCGGRQGSIGLRRSFALRQAAPSGTFGVRCALGKSASGRAALPAFLLRPGGYRQISGVRSGCLAARCFAIARILLPASARQVWVAA